MSPALVCGFVIALRPIISDTKGISLYVRGNSTWVVSFPRLPYLAKRAVRFTVLRAFLCRPGHVFKSVFYCSIFALPLS